MMTTHEPRPHGPETGMPPPPAGSATICLQRATRGDVDAIEQLLQRVRPFLRRIAKGRLPRHARSHMETEDIIQNVQIRTVRHLPRFEEQRMGDLRNWMSTVARNLVRDEQRVAARRVMLPLPDDLATKASSPEGQAIDRERATTLRQALRHLDPADRALITHRYLQALPHDEVATLVGKPSSNAARMAGNRALRRLRDEVRRLRTRPGTTRPGVARTRGPAGSAPATGAAA